MARIKVGVIGGGGVAQIEHVPNLLRLKDKFEIVGVCDPSAAVRKFMLDRYGIAGFDQIDALFDLSLDAIVIASPDALHKEHALAALNRGLHVFCEKPLCYAPADILELAACRDAQKRVLQVGYMKRFDPSFEAALATLPGSAKTLRQVAVEVSDPDAWPFIRHHDWRRGEDIPATLIAEVGIKQREQVVRAVGMPLDAQAFRGFCNAYSSAIVHDVNAVHGLLDALQVPHGEVVGGQFFANGDGGHGAVRLMGGQALWTMSHLAVPSLPEYRERITLYFDDAALELEFPSPWLNHQPTRLTIKQADGNRLHTKNIHVGYEEAFIEELKGFWSAITEGTAVRNTAEHATRDMELLCAMATWHATHSPQTILKGISS